MKYLKKDFDDMYMCESSDVLKKGMDLGFRYLEVSKMMDEEKICKNEETCYFNHSKTNESNLNSENIQIIIDKLIEEKEGITKLKIIK